MGHEKTHFKAVLGCEANRTKLLQMVIFKWKTMQKEKFPPVSSFTFTKREDGH